jgi:radical SAM superfamily enzyme with C-terminal helix-hairpin-helix motif
LGRRTRSSRRARKRREESRESFWESVRDAIDLLLLSRVTRGVGR